MGLKGIFGKKCNAEKDIMEESPIKETRKTLPEKKDKKAEDDNEKPKLRGMYTFVIENTFSAKEFGCVVVGITDGVPIRVMDKINVISRNNRVILSQVMSIENLQREKLEEAPTGERVALLLADISAEQVGTGDVVSNIKHQTSVNANTPIMNPRLRGLMAWCARQNTQLVTTLILEEATLNAHFLSAVLFTEVPDSDVNGTMILQESTKIQYPVVTSADNRRWIPAFTDWEELQKWKNYPANKNLIFDFKGYQTLILSGVADGIAIDPFGANLLLDRGLMEKLALASQDAASEERGKHVAS